MPFSAPLCRLPPLFAIVLLCVGAVHAAEYPEPTPGEGEAASVPRSGGGDGLPDVQHGLNLAREGEPGRTTDEERGKTEADEEVEIGGLLGKRLHGRPALFAEYIYTGEVFTNTRGGISTHNATDYRGVFDLVLQGDLDKLEWFPGGRVFIYAQNGHGRGLTADYVGDFQCYSNIDAEDFTQVSEYWWEKSVFDGLMGVRLGKQDCNAEFAVCDLAGDFIQSSFGFHPTVPMPSYPHGSMAAVAFFQVAERHSFKAGVWDGMPDGRNWGFSGTGQVFSIIEWKSKYELGEGMPGDWHVGTWYHNGEFDDLSSAPEPEAVLSFGLFPSKRMRPVAAAADTVSIAAANDPLAGSYGVYAGIDQMIWKERRDKENAQGLGIFGQYGWAPPERSEAEHFVGVGLIYKGLIPARDDDTCGAGIARVYFSRLLNRDSETAIELFYKARVTKYIAVQPDLQIICSPSGIYRDAVLAGLRFELVL